MRRYVWSVRCSLSPQAATLINQRSRSESCQAPELSSPTGFRSRNSRRSCTGGGTTPRCCGLLLRFDTLASFFGTQTSHLGSALGDLAFKARLRCSPRGVRDRFLESAVNAVDYLLCSTSLAGTKMRSPTSSPSLKRTGYAFRPWLQKQTSLYDQVCRAL